MAIRNELIKTSLRATVTQSSANTYAEQQIDTNLSIRGDHVFIITGVWMGTNVNLSGDTDVFRMQLTYASQDDIIEANNSDWLMGYSWKMNLATSGGGIWAREVYVPVNMFPVATANLFLGVTSASLSTTGSGFCKIEGFHHKVNSTEFFRMAQSR